MLPLRTRLTSMYPLHLDPNPEPTGGGAKPEETPARRANTLLDALIRRHGSPEAALAVLSAQNVTLEDENTRLTQTVAQQRKQIPDPEKFVVLPKERVETLNAFETHKVKPEDVGKLIADNAELKRKDHVHGIEALAKKGAPAIGFDPEATLDLVTGKGLHLELREVEVEVEKGGKKVKERREAPFVRPASDERAALEPLAEFAKKLPAFEQRALKAQAPAPEGGDTKERVPAGTPYLDQSRSSQQGGEGGVASAVLGQIQQRYPSPSELRKQTQEPTHAA